MLSWDNDNVVTADINQRMIEASSGQKAVVAWVSLRAFTNFNLG